MFDPKVVSIGTGKPQAPSEPPPKFKIGDVVQLQSGGLAMTVRKASRGSVTVDWHGEGGDLCTAEFHPAMILLCPPNEEMEIEVTLDGPSA